MKDYKKIETTLKEFFSLLDELRNLNILTNKKDFTCQLEEWLVQIIYDGQRAVSGIQKHWDIKSGEKCIQVKAHAKAEKTKAPWITTLFGLPRVFLQ